MSCHRRFARRALLSGVLVLTPALALAQNKDHSFEMALSTTFTHFDTQTELTYRMSPSVLLGYNFTKRHGAELIFNSLSATPRRGESFNVDVDTLRIGYVFNDYPKPKIVSFFRVGLGAWALDPEPHAGASSRLSEKDTAMMLYSGGGFRLFFTPHIAMRFAASIDFLETGAGFAHMDVQATGDLGVSFLMGGREPVEKPAAPAAEKPAEKPAEPKKP